MGTDRYRYTDMYRIVPSCTFGVPWYPYEKYRVMPERYIRGHIRGYGTAWRDGGMKILLDNGGGVCYIVGVVVVIIKSSIMWVVRLPLLSERPSVSDVQFIA